MDTGDCLNGPSPMMVELAELLVEIIPAADWAMMAKNGTDATTACVTIARAATGKRKILAASAPTTGPPVVHSATAGCAPEDRAHHPLRVQRHREPPAAAEEAGDDLAGAIVTPFSVKTGRPIGCCTACTSVTRCGGVSIQ